jgi:hypothetical protein
MSQALCASMPAKTVLVETVQLLGVPNDYETGRVVDIFFPRSAEYTQRTCMF